MSVWEWVGGEEGGGGGWIRALKTSNEGAWATSEVRLFHSGMVMGNGRQRVALIYVNSFFPSH